MCKVSGFRFSIFQASHFGPYKVNIFRFPFDYEALTFSVVYTKVIRSNNFQIDLNLEGVKTI